MSPPRVVIVGPMGAGKTRVGKRVARLLDVGCTDTDKTIVAEPGPIAGIFAEPGEPWYRALARAAVVADLESQRVVYLTVTARAVEGRLGAGKRPLIRDGTDDWQRIFDERRGLYEHVSDLELDTSHRPYDSIAEEVAEWARTPA